MFNFGFKFGRSSGLSPCTQFLIAQFTGALTSAADAYLSKIGTEDREVFKGRSLKPDGIMSGTVPDMLATDTLTNSGNSVLTPGNGTVDFTAGSCWDIEWKRGDTVLGFFPCVTGIGLTVENVADKDNPMTLVVDPEYVDDVWQEHIDGGGSDYLNQFGYTDCIPTKYLILYTTPTVDSIGESSVLTDISGKGNDVSVFGHTILWDGGKFGKLRDTITLVSDFKIKIKINPDPLGGILRILGTGPTNMALFGANIWMYFGGWYSYSDLPDLLDSEGYEIEFSRVGDQGTVTYSGESQTLTVPETDFVFTHIAAESASSTQKYKGLIPWIELYNSSGILTNHWVVESANLLPQTTIYDIEGGNHATVQETTGSQFTELVTPSYLAVNGGVTPTGMLNTGFAFYGGLQEADFDTGATIAGAVGGKTIIYNTVERRIRQDGNIAKVTINVDGFTSGDTFKLKTFRENGASYDFVDESESISVTATGLQTHTLPTPVECVPGDLVGIYLSSVSISLKNTTTTDGADSVKYSFGDITSTNSFSSSLSNQSLDIDAQGTAPFLAVTGDSIAEGHNTDNHNHSFYSDGPGGTPSSEMANQMKALIDAEGTPFGNYQNHAKHSEAMAWVALTGGVSSFATGAKAILVHAGINDIAGGGSWSTAESSYNLLRSKLEAGQHLFIDEILASTPSTDEKAAIIRDWNTNLSIWCAANGATMISCHDAMGQTRVSTGELDDLLEAYSRDGTHLTQAGVDALAAIWKTSLEAFYLSGDVYEVIPYGASSLPNDFNGVLDAPQNTFVMNFPENAEMIASDTTELLFSSGTAKDVDPYDMPTNTANNIFKGDKAILDYSVPLTGADITKAEKYVG